MVIVTLEEARWIVLIDQIKFSARGEGATDDNLDADLAFLKRQLRGLAKRRKLKLTIGGDVHYDPPR